MTELAIRVQPDSVADTVLPSFTSLPPLEPIRLEPMPMVTELPAADSGHVLPSKNRLALAAKHGLDSCLAALGLLALFPLLVVVALAIRLDSPGSPLFRQERIGRDGRPFHIWKFRTMRTGADAELSNLLVQHSRHDVPLFKIPDDPRVTRLGRFLRKYSVDELPQLWNVVRGDMSLVGPRPQRSAEVELYTSRERLRLAMKPGLTGLWQVNGRSELEWELAVKHDLKYVRSWTLALDAQILARTVKVVVSGAGAT